MKVVIDREVAINNIAFMLHHKGFLAIGKPDPGDRLQPMLALSPVVKVIANCVDAATFHHLTYMQAVVPPDHEGQDDNGQGDGAHGS